MNLRIVVSSIAGVVVIFFALVCASRTTGRILQIPQEYPVSSDSFAFREAIDRFRTRYNRLPGDLTQLGLREDESLDSPLRFDDAGRPLDPWDTPYVYRVDGDRYDIVTLGGDRQPGGVGGNADVLVAPLGENEGPRFEPPTLWQFTFQYATAGMIATCAGAGVCTFLVGALQGNRSGKPVARLEGLIVSLAGVGALSAFVAGVLALSHLPFEHH